MLSAKRVDSGVLAPIEGDAHVNVAVACPQKIGGVTRPSSPVRDRGFWWWRLELKRAGGIEARHVQTKTSRKKGKFVPGDNSS